MRRIESVNLRSEEWNSLNLNRRRKIGKQTTLQGPVGNNKGSNICSIRIPEEEEKESEAERLF